MPFGPRMIGERKTYNALPQVIVEPGDILLCKEFDNQHDGHFDSDNLAIRTGQAVFSHMRRGSANSEHAELVFTMGTDGAPGTVAEANGPGVLQSTWAHRDAVVFRCNNPTLIKEALYVASRLTTVDTTINTGSYSFGKAVGGMFRNRGFGPIAKKYVTNLYNIVYSQDVMPQGQKVQAPSMFCSQFVTACYEVAAMRTGIRSLHVAPQAMSVKALEAMLERNPHVFTKMGRVKEPVAWKGLVAKRANQWNNFVRYQQNGNRVMGGIEPHRLA